MGAPEQTQLRQAQEIHDPLVALSRDTCRDAVLFFGIAEACMANPQGDRYTLV